MLLALTGFEPALRFVDHVNAAFATHNTAITMPVLERAERIANLHGRFLMSWRGPAPGCGRPGQTGPVKQMVGDTGIEPVTPSMSTKCSTAELITPYVTQNLRPQQNGARKFRAGSGVYK